MYRMLIVGNSDEHAERMRELVSKAPSGRRFAVEALTGLEEVPGRARTGSVDAVLMDVVFESQPLGIEAVARYFPLESGARVAYVSDDAAFCTKAYDTDHVYFLVWPLNVEGVEQALRRVLSALAQREEQCVCVKCGGHAVKLLVRSIDFVESNRRKVIIHNATRPPVEAYLTLGEMEERLPPSFLRTHQSYLVNMDRIAKLEGDCLYLLSGKKIPVSQKRRREARDRFYAYVNGCGA